MKTKLDKETGELIDNLPVIPFRHAYGPKLRLQQDFSFGGRTKQEFKDECDVNRIMAIYAKTGQINHLASKAPTFTDVQDIDFQGAMNIVAEAREYFDAMPSDVRERFANNPSKLLEFVQDDKNRPEALRMGLLRADVPSSDTPAPTTPADVTKGPSDASAAKNA